MPKGKPVVITEEGTDDFDGKPLSDEDAQSVYLAVDGQAWNLYLRDENVQKLNDFLSKFTQNAEPAKAKPAAAGASIGMNKEEREALMNWSRETEGIPAVAERGRVKESTLQAWKDAGKPGYNE